MTTLDLRNEPCATVDAVLLSRQLEIDRGHHIPSQMVLTYDQMSEFYADLQRLQGGWTPPLGTDAQFHGMLIRVADPDSPIHSL